MLGRPGLSTPILAKGHTACWDTLRLRRLLPLPLSWQCPACSNYQVCSGQYGQVRGEATQGRKPS